MKIAHLNVRLGEGGAARIARDLHGRQLALGHDSTFLYGYGRGARASKEEFDVPATYRIASMPTTLGNYASHSLIGVDVLSPNSDCVKRVRDIFQKIDVLHLHVVHSYLVSFRWLFREIRSYPFKIVWTAHDHWLLTGRCAVVGSCNRWKVGCGSCKQKSAYPPAFFDRSGVEFQIKRRLVSALSDRLTVVAPSAYLAEKLTAELPGVRVAVVPNGVDRHFEDAPITFDRQRSNKTGLTRALVVAADLSSSVKVDVSLICSSLDAKFELHTVGLRSPFKGPNVVNHGAVNSRAELIRLMQFVDVVLFTSTVDSFGLVIVESLCTGTPVVALASGASDEIMKTLGARAVDTGEFSRTVMGRTWWELYKQKTQRSLREHALSIYSGSAMYRGYMDVYRAAQ